MMFGMTNCAALGYAIMAAEAAGLEPQQIDRLIEAMRASFDEVTEAQAESYYLHGDY